MISPFISGCSAVAPLALQNVITYSVSLADNMMVGQLGELSLSAVFVSTRCRNILHMLVLGLSAALSCWRAVLAASGPPAHTGCGR